MRQALFDMLAHAPWAEGRLVGASVLDGFAGTGALGLEALSRGAAQAIFIERDQAALAALRANVAACRAEEQARVIAMDITRPPPGAPCGLVFLDPPYAQELVPKAVAALGRAGWLTNDALVVAETGRDEALELAGKMVAERAHGAARVTVWRMGSRI